MYIANRIFLNHTNDLCHENNVIRDENMLSRQKKEKKITFIHKCQRKIATV